MPKNRLLIISPNWPAPDYSAAGVRLMQLVDFFKDQGNRVAIASTADKFSADADRFEGVSLIPVQLNHKSFDDVIKRLNPDIVLFDRFMTEEQFGWRVAENVPNAIRILDTEDLHSLRKSRETALKGAVPWTRENWLRHDTTKREVASILRSDLSLIISPFEMELLASVLPNHRSLLLHLPFMVAPPSDAEIDEWPSFEERKDFVFIGFGGHRPNIDAIEHLKKDIWPLVRRRVPKAKLNIYGGNLPERIYRLHTKDEGFLIHGWAENAHKVVSRSRVMLAPLRFGAGQKGKLVDAMLCGTPSMTTTIGAEGMYDGLDWNGQISDEPESFAEAAVKAYRDKSVWTAHQKNGLELIERIFERKKRGKDLKNKLTELQLNLSAHRDINFIGQLLQHQTLVSTKYMSKWIEAKNRRP